MTPNTQEYIEAAKENHKTYRKMYADSLDEEGKKKQKVIEHVVKLLSDNNIDSMLVARPNDTDGFLNYVNTHMDYENDKPTKETDERTNDLFCASGFFVFYRYYQYIMNIKFPDMKSSKEDRIESANEAFEMLRHWQNSYCSKYNIWDKC